MEQWKTLSKKTILDYSKFLTVEEHCVELPDGRVIEDWPWIITPDFVNVIPVTEDGRFVFLRQVKYALEGVSVAPIGGYIEKGEDPLSCAKRELLEEAGYEADDWKCLGTFGIDSNRGAGSATFYLAQKARFTEKLESDDLEESELILLSRQEIEDAIDGGEVKMAPWLAGILMALRALS